MSEKLLRKKDIAAMLGTSPCVAASILASHGCHAIDFGRGRSRGPRWLESAVCAALYEMHNEVQEKNKKRTRRQIKGSGRALDKPLALMSADEVARLVTYNPLPASHIIQ